MTFKEEPSTAPSLPSENLDIPTSMLEILVEGLKSQGSRSEILSDLLNSPDYDVFHPEDFASEPFSPFIGSSMEFQEHGQSDLM